MEQLAKTTHLICIFGGFFWGLNTICLRDCGHFQAHFQDESQTISITITTNCLFPKPDQKHYSIKLNPQNDLFKCNQQPKSPNSGCKNTPAATWSLELYYLDNACTMELCHTHRKRMMPVLDIAKANPRIPLPMMALLRLKTDIPNEVFPSNCN